MDMKAISAAKLSARRLKRSKSESFKIAARPLLQYMRTWAPFLSYLLGFVAAILIGCVPAAAKQKNALSLVSAWASSHESLKIQVQIYGSALLMFNIQSHFVMIQTLLRSRQLGHQLKSAEIVRKQTPAVAGFFFGVLISFVSGLLPCPKVSMIVVDVSCGVLSRVTPHFL